MSSGPKPAPTTADLPGGKLSVPVPMSQVAASLRAVGGAATQPGPDSPSGDFKLMQALWDKVNTIAGGTDAMRKADKKYLPKFNLEDEEDYKDRVASTPFVNVYEDVVSSLCAKPFSREVQFEDPDDVDQAYKDLYEDIDGQGNNMHVFAERTFRDGVDCAMDWILIDYTKLPALPEGRTARSLAEEQALGARPYWVHVPAASVIAAYSTMVRGKEVLTHVRLLEPTLVRDGYGETVENRVREYNREPITAPDGQDDYAPATWVLQRKVKNQNGQEVWELVEYGTVAIEIIPLVPFVVGKRMGNGWAARAPLSNLLDMQIDAFQQESNLRNIELMACFPMLTANGVQQPTDQSMVPGGKPTPVKVRTGPRAVLWAPPPPGGTGTPGSWAFIEPSATSLSYLKGRLDGTYERMREIGMQPLAESPQTVITSANVSVKANSALQAWALRLKDTLEQCLVVTTLWLGGDPSLSPGADVYTDFGVDVQGAAELSTLTDANKNKSLSNQTYREELKRRNVLSGNFNEAEEEQRLAEEAAASADAEPGDGSEGDIDPATGEPLEAANDAGEPADPSEFADASDIDDATLEAMFGTTGE